MSTRYPHTCGGPGDTAVLSSRHKRAAGAPSPAETPKVLPARLPLTRWHPRGRGRLQGPCQPLVQERLFGGTPSCLRH